MHRTAIDPPNLILDNASGGSVDTHQPKAQRVIVFAGGDLLTNPSPDAGAIVIAADTGYDHAISLGHRVDLLVGDFDSISENGLAHAQAEGVEIERHPASKDATDLQLALEAALIRGASAIDIYGGEAGRIGHLLGVAVGLTAEQWIGANITWHTETATVRPVLGGDHVHLDAAIGSVVSLIVVSDAAGVTTQGLRWQLTGEDLPGGTSRGMSNELVKHPASVSLDRGALLAVTEPGGHS